MIRLSHKRCVYQIVVWVNLLTMSRSDRRVRRTRNLLATALLDLAGERPFQAITIREITERADVGYATFFRHYPSKEALLLDVLSGIVDDLADLLQPIADEGRLEEAGAELFTYVAEHAQHLRVLLAAQRGTSSEADVRKSVRERVMASPGFRTRQDLPPELAAHHLATASLELINWWLENEMPYGPDRMGRIYAQLVVQPIRNG